MATLPPTLRLEMAFALQCRMQARRAQMIPLIFGQVVRWLRDRGAGSVLERGETYWSADAERRFPVRAMRGNPLGWLRFVRQCSLRLREQHSGHEVWQWDTWPIDQLDIDRRWAYQPTRRIYFAEIDPSWLRELVKRWAKWRLTGATKSPASISVSTSSLRRFCRWAEDRGATPAAPAAITRDLLERLLSRRDPARPQVAAAVHRRVRDGPARDPTTHSAGSRISRRGPW